MKYILFIIMLLILPLVVAIPPQELEAIEGLTLETNVIEYHPINTTFYLHTHVFDTKSGLLQNNTALSCFYHLYSEEANWQHINTGNLTGYGAGYFVNINETLFNNTGLYSVMLWCNSLTMGGYKQFTFEVYQIDKNKVQIWTCPDKSSSWVFFLILGLGVVCLMGAYIMQESLLGIFAGIFIFASYFFIGACSMYLFSPILLIGLLIALRFSFI